MFSFHDVHAPGITIDHAQSPCKMNDLKENLNNVRRRVETACLKAGRSVENVRIIAVSKRHPAARIAELHTLGQDAFGENRIQEALPKIESLASLDLEWHFIGPLQSNKAAEAALHFDWVQSVDRSKILRRLSSHRPAALDPLNILVQVNIDEEPQKTGVLPSEVENLVEQALSLPGIHLRGLMSIPRMATSEHDPADSFARMRALFDHFRAAGVKMDTLSMGMSADLESAIMHGSTMVRVGTDLFGPRPS
jgi:pyridoxal phosphate enzyme (YggS family)